MKSALFLAVAVLMSGAISSVHAGPPAAAAVAASAASSAAAARRAKHNEECKDEISERDSLREKVNGLEYQNAELQRLNKALLSVNEKLRRRKP